MSKELDLINIEIEETKVELDAFPTAFSILGGVVVSMVLIGYSANTLLNFNEKAIGYTLFFSMFVLALATITLNNHWTTKRSNLSSLYAQKKELIKGGKKKK
ncbi:MAG TPA: hypothetical protein VEC16_06240 [Alphaproteobacteria bacterium]|nr:hypothetical protein [Alphaproteobacteria bacterium]